MRLFKKYLKLVCLTSFLLNFTNIYSQDKLGFYLGYNLLLNSKDNHYNVNGIFHKVKPNDEYRYYGSDLNKYLYIANSILVGQELSLEIVCIDEIIIS